MCDYAGAVAVGWPGVEMLVWALYPFFWLWHGEVSMDKKPGGSGTRRVRVRCAQCGKRAKIAEICSNLSIALGFPPVRYLCDACWRINEQTDVGGDSSSEPGRGA